MKNIIVLFGGKSVEHDISIITAMQILRCVPKEYNVIPIYIKKDGRWNSATNLDCIEVYLDFDKNAKKKKDVVLLPGCNDLYEKGRFKFKKIAKIDGALMCLHGGAGEDGSVSSLLEMCNIPYTSSMHTSSAICMDKIFTKLVLSSQNILNVPFLFFNKKDYVKDKKKVVEKIKHFGFPIILKPANLGSSVGIEIVKNQKDLEEHVEKAFMFDDKVLIEKFLKDAEEYNCACMEVEKELVTSKVVRVEKSEIFTFKEKYIEKNEKKPLKIKKTIEKQVSYLTKEVYKLLDCKGVVRIDFLYKDDVLYVNEINTIPGSLSISMFNNFSRIEFVDILIKEAINSCEEKFNLDLSYESEAIRVFKEAVEKERSLKFS